jgi:hypothetical protein
VIFGIAVPTIVKSSEARNIASMSAMIMNNKPRADGYSSLRNVASSLEAGTSSSFSSSRSCWNDSDMVRSCRGRDTGQILLLEVVISGFGCVVRSNGMHKVYLYCRD